MVSKEKKDHRLYIILEGRIDANNANEFHEEFSDIDQDINILVFDLENFNYISSAGLRVFLRLYKEMKARDGKIFLNNVNDLVYSIFDSTGMTNLLFLNEQN